MKFILIREKADGRAVRGTLQLPKRVRPLWVAFECKTLENADFLIPPGTYPLALTYSPKFKRPMPLIMNVPHRSGIRIHPGTKPEHSTGCVLVPTREQEALIARHITEKNIKTIEIYDEHHEIKA